MNELSGFGLHKKQDLKNRDFTAARWRVNKNELLVKGESIGETPYIYIYIYSSLDLVSGLGNRRENCLDEPLERSTFAGISSP